MVFAGLPGSGQFALARGVADAIGATYLRIDSIESAIVSTLAPYRDNPVGYVVAERVAADQLVAGRDVVADAVNGVAAARAGWVALAARTHAVPRFVEAGCSDAAEHRRRVETREPEYVRARRAYLGAGAEAPLRTMAAGVACPAHHRQHRRRSSARCADCQRTTDTDRNDKGTPLLNRTRALARSGSAMPLVAAAMRCGWCTGRVARSWCRTGRSGRSRGRLGTPAHAGWERRSMARSGYFH